MKGQVFFLEQFLRFFFLVLFLRVFFLEQFLRVFFLVRVLQVCLLIKVAMGFLGTFLSLAHRLSLCPEESTLPQFQKQGV